METPQLGLEDLALMREGVAFRQEIRIRAFRVLLRPLTNAETNMVTAQVIAEMKNAPEEYRNSLSENTLLAKKTLHLASTSEPMAKDPKLTEYLLDQMTNDEINTLWKEYCGVIERVNPIFDRLSTETVRALVEEVKKNPSRVIELSFTEMANVCRLLTSDD